MSRRSSQSPSPPRSSRSHDVVWNDCHRILYFPPSCSERRYKGWREFLSCARIWEFPLTKRVWMTFWMWSRECVQLSPQFPRNSPCVKSYHKWVWLLFFLNGDSPTKTSRRHSMVCEAKIKKRKTQIKKKTGNQKEFLLDKKRLIIYLKCNAVKEFGGWAGGGIKKCVLGVKIHHEKTYSHFCRHLCCNRMKPCFILFYFL